MSRTRRLLVIVLVVQATLSVCVAYGFESVRNTLDRNGNWISGKVLLDSGIMGARTYLGAPSSLSQRRVNLGRYQGFQELLYRDPLTVRAVSCDMHLEQGSYGIVVFNRTDAGFSGIRVSRNPRFPGLYFTALPTGEFVRTRPVDTDERGGEGWAHVGMEFRDTGFVASLDGRELIRSEDRIAQPQTIGMRGGYVSTLVDDFRIVHADGEFLDTFDRAGDFWSALLAAILAHVVVDLLVFRSVRRRGSEPIRALFGMLMVGLVATICAGATLYVYDRVISKSYLIRVIVNDEDFRPRLETKRRAEIRERHAVRPAEHKTRVLVIGSSQTHGEGSSAAGKGCMDVLQRTLGPRFEVINAGLRAFRAPRLATIFEEDWSELRPAIVAVNLGNNDDDVPAFKEGLSRIATRCRKIGAKLLFVQEANSIEHDLTHLRTNHSAMAEVAREFGIPVVPMHDYMSKQIARGLLWWDIAHPTDFGHRLIGEHLAPRIASLADS